MEFRIEMVGDYVYIGIPPMTEDLNILDIAQLLLEIENAGKEPRFEVPPLRIHSFLEEMGFKPNETGFTWTR